MCSGMRIIGRKGFVNKMKITFCGFTGLLYFGA